MLNNEFKVGDRVLVLVGDKWGDKFKKGNIVVIKSINVSKLHPYISGRVEECIYLHSFRYSNGNFCIAHVKKKSRYNIKRKIIKL